MLTLAVVAAWLLALSTGRHDARPGAHAEWARGARAAKAPALSFVGAGASISGSVREPEGAAIAGATVCANRVVPDGASQPRPLCTTSTREGGYALRELAPARYRIVASAENHVPSRSSGLAAADGVITFEGAALTGIDVVLRRGGARIAGTTEDAAGGPIAFASLSVLTILPARSITLAQSDEQGRFELFVADGSQLLLRASAPGYAPARRRVVAPAHGFALTLIPASRLSGHVISARGGQGVGGVEVHATKGFSNMRVDGDGATTSASDGSFAIDGLAEGRFQLSARGAHWSSKQQIAIELGLADSRDVRLEVVPAVPVEGRAFAQGDTPCASGKAMLRDAHAGGGAAIEITSAIESDGRIRFEGVPSGGYRVTVACAEAPVRSDYPELWVGEHEIRDLVFRTEAGATLSGRMIDRLGRGLPRTLRLEAVEIDGAANASTRAAPKLLQGAADGSFAVANLLPGRHRILGASGEPIREVELMAGETTSIEIVIPDGASLRIRATTASGCARHGDVMVYAADSGEQRPSWTPPLQPDGSFLLHDLAPGEYVVAAGDGRNPIVQVAHNLRAGAETVVELHVPSYRGILRGRVIDAGGAPVDDAWVHARARGDMTIRFGAREGVLTGPDGAFEIADLAPHAAFSVEARRSSGEYAEIDDARAGQTLTLVLQQTAAALEPTL